MSRVAVLLSLSLLIIGLVGCSGSSSPSPLPRPTSEAPKYERDAFGAGWRDVDRHCDTRDLVLARDLRATDTTFGCNVVTGAFTDPYTGMTFAGSTRELDIDHVVPLSEAWRLGAWQWSDGRREDFANDLENLQTTLARVNRAKGDDGLDQWQPDRDPCGYSWRFDRVADRWGLSDTQRDDQVRRVCTP